MCYERYPRFHTSWGPERWSDQLSISQHPCSWLPPARESHRQPERGILSEREKEGEKERAKKERIKKRATQLDLPGRTKPLWKWICPAYTNSMRVHVCGDLQPSHLIESWKVSLPCLPSSSHTHTYTLERSRRARTAKCQKNSDLSIQEIALNLAISWITTSQAQLATSLWHCPYSKKLSKVRYPFTFSVKLPIKLSPTRTQTPILNADAITLVWCTALGRNFP